jgi:hypothetical protein
MDQKHGFYYLRIGTNSNHSNLNLTVQMLLKGNRLESTEK